MGLNLQETIPVTIINPPCEIKLQPTQLLPKIIYIGESTTYSPHFDIKRLKETGATFGDCTKANFIFQYKINGKITSLPNSWLGINSIQNEYVFLHN